MEQSIGENAGKVWQVLHEKGGHTPSALTKVLGLKTSDVDRALGWLAREGKLSFDSDGKGGTKLSLKE